MNIFKNSINEKSKSGQLVLSLTNTDDVYLLSNILQPGDKVETTTTRKVNFDGKSQHKIVCRLEIIVESISGDLEYGVLSVKGKTSKENEYISLGSYHTLNITLQQKFSIDKLCWSIDDINSIKNAVNEKQELLFIIFYETNCVISSLGKSKCVKLNTYGNKIKDFKMITNSINTHSKDYKMTIIASHCKIGHEYYTRSQKELNCKITYLHLTPDYKDLPNNKVLLKIITDSGFNKIFSDIQYVEELKECQKFFNHFNNGDPMTFIGFKELDEAFNYGALEKLFIVDKLYRPETIEKRKVIEKIINEAKEFRAKIFVIPIDNPLGENLNKLGGIAGTLLFNYKN